VGGKGGEDGGDEGGLGGDEGGLGIGGGVTSPPSPNSPYGDHMGGYGPKISQFLRFWGGGLLGRGVVSIANELDRERSRNLRGETETEIVQNSNVLVDFEVRT
jgi:hypothetical protein